MSEDVAESLPALVAAVLAALREGDDALSPVARVCRACVGLLPVDGAAISIILGTRHRQSLYASDAVAEHVETLQFSLGEGPCFEAFHTGQPVLVPDLAEDAGRSWPMFAAEIDGVGIGAIFAFPLRRGAARVGAMDMYRRRPGWLSQDELATALQIADIATSALLAASASGTDGEINEEWLATVTRHKATVHQATGIVIAEFGIAPEQALARLRGYAFAAGRMLDEVADDLVAGRLSAWDIDT